MRTVREHSIEGQEVIAWAEARIAKYTKSIIAMGVTEQRTQDLRSRINELQKLIDSVKNTGEDYAD